MPYNLSNLLAGLKAYTRTLWRSLIGKSHKDIEALFEAYEELLEEYGDLATRFAASQKQTTTKKKPAKTTK